MTEESSFQPGGKARSRHQSNEAAAVPRIGIALIAIDRPAMYQNHPILGVGVTRIFPGMVRRIGDAQAQAQDSGGGQDHGFHFHLPYLPEAAGG
jgi:hypothetical protein